MTPQEQPDSQAGDEPDEVLYQFRSTIADLGNKYIGMPKGSGELLYQEVKQAQAVAKARLDAYAERLATKRAIEARIDELQKWLKVPAVQLPVWHMNKRIEELSATLTKEAKK